MSMCMCSCGHPKFPTMVACAQGQSQRNIGLIISLGFYIGHSVFYKFKLHPIKFMIIESNGVRLAVAL